MTVNFGCSLETVNMLSSGPNFIYKQSKSFWTNYFKYVAAVGFRGIELPFNPFNSDPMAFEMGRCGIPLSAFAVQAKYGSPGEFMAFLRGVGIDKVTSVHLNANDVVLEILAAGRSMDDYFQLYEQAGLEAIDHLVSLGGKGLVISPSAELGWLEKLVGGDLDGAFTDRTIGVLAKLVHAAAHNGIQVALKTEYWSLFRGPKMAGLLQRLPGAYLCPDLAHLAIAGDPVNIVLNAHKDQIAFMRLSDTAFTDNFANFRKINAELPVEGPQKVFCDLGEGKVDLLGACRILRDNGYNGWIICENKKTLDVYKGLLKLGWFTEFELVRKL
jgi:sugar phosphate isomerase/epimerase